ncbi:MAG TPA: hypothetical protein VF017_04250 [Thermoanaerobaculia bacterium]|nr:hypothetical protein [Thermoanaerobaculia bacterium]
MSTDQGTKAAPVRPGRSVMDLAGLLHRPGMTPLTSEEMDEAIIEHCEQEDERIRREWHLGSE